MKIKIIPSKNTVIFINDLFKNFLGIFPSTGALFKTQDDFDNAKKTWYKGFLNYGLVNSNGDVDQNFLKNGILKCEKLNQSFMPSLGQFIALCEKIDSHENIQCNCEMHNLVNEKNIDEIDLDELVKKIHAQLNHEYNGTFVFNEYENLLLLCSPLKNIQLNSENDRGVHEIEAIFKDGNCCVIGEFSKDDVESFEKYKTFKCFYLAQNKIKFSFKQPKAKYPSWMRTSEQCVDDLIQEELEEEKKGKQAG